MLGKALKMSHRYKFAKAPVADAAAIVGGDGKKYRFTMLTDGLIRYEYAEDGQFEDRASTFALFRKLPVPKFRVIDLEDGGLQIVTARARLTYDRKSFTTNGLKAEVLGNVSDWKSVWRYGSTTWNLGGTARTLDEANGKIPLMEGILSRNGFAAVEDSDTMLFEEDGWVGVRKPGDRVDGYIFLYGTDYRDALKAFFTLSGKPPLLPRWALGNWWSRYYPYTQDGYIELMDKFKQEEVPLSIGVIDMDWHHVDSVDPKYGSGWTGYSWNKEFFPDPKEFTKQLHDRDVKLTLNVHPADGIRAFEDCYKKLAEHMDQDTDHEDPVQFDVTSKKFLDGYFDIVHRDLEKDGVDFWWIDWQQGPYSRVPGIDPLWVLNHVSSCSTHRLQFADKSIVSLFGQWQRRYKTVDILALRRSWFSSISCRFLWRYCRNVGITCFPARVYSYCIKHWLWMVVPRYRRTHGEFFLAPGNNTDFA